MRLRHVFIVLAALASILVVSEPASAQTSCGTRLLRDWSDGRIDGVYPVRCYRLALANMPEDVRIYSTAESDIKRALQARVRATHAKATVLKAAAPASAKQGNGVSLWLVVGISADKDKAGILGALVPLAQRVICTAADNARATPPETLAELARLAAGDSTVRVETARSPVEALRLALAEPDTPMVCVAGSLFMIGEIFAQATENTDIFSQSAATG